MQPEFAFTPTEPEYPNRLRVTLKSNGEVLGIAYLTRGAGWVAEHAGLLHPQGAVHGFKTEQLAAEFLYWFKAPEQSGRSKSRGMHIPRSLNPEVLPEPGALISLMQCDNGDCLVDVNTRGAGFSIGYLRKLDNDQYEVRHGKKIVGTANSPETGMWAALRAYTNDEVYAKIVAGFEPDEQPKTVEDQAEDEEASTSVRTRYAVTWRWTEHPDAVRNAMCIVDSAEMTRPGDPEQRDQLIRVQLANSLPIGQGPETVILDMLDPICNCEPHPEPVNCRYATHSGRRFYLASTSNNGYESIIDRHGDKVLGTVSHTLSVEILTLVREKYGHQ
ncbi:hypothetical protein [Streptomyces malaysiensis]|uniref:Uncharacterized protein n=1 Tax=Streptomyces malaysiensis TaxID=92644 RepID=A0A7X6B038_STRMQ|nr:hypothetical protein [Streptomyces malaysiensis]NIY68106.1 hypothetical protein [Streptomyces malaysiensis]